MLFYVDPEKCNRDGICVEACGRRLIEMGEADSVPTLITGVEELCINCGHCVAVCPSGALALHTMRPKIVLKLGKSCSSTWSKRNSFFDQDAPFEITGTSLLNVTS